MKNISIAAALVLASAALWGCKAKIDSTKLEEAIMSGLKEKGGTEMESMSCPKDVEAKAGGTFECSGKAKTGKAVVVGVTQKDDQGNVDWKLKSIDGVVADGADSAGAAVSPSATASNH